MQPKMNDSSDHFDVFFLKPDECLRQFRTPPLAGLYVYVVPNDKFAYQIPPKAYKTFLLQHRYMHSFNMVCTAAKKVGTENFHKSS